jgi:hypothetical protein
MVVQNDIDDFKRKFNELTKTAGAVVEQKKQLDAIDAWHKDNVNWFEQLNWRRQNALSAQDMMIRDLSFSSTNGGTITFAALLRDQTVLASMVDKLRDADHALQTGARGPESGNAKYNFRCALTLSLSKDAVAADLSTRAPQPPEP